MFATDVYSARRQALMATLNTGLVLLPGNGDAPMNYRDNVYAFRQDSTFLYFFGLDRPDLAGVIDLDSAETTVYGDELTMDDVIWRGPQPTIAEQARAAGVSRTVPRGDIRSALRTAAQQGRRIHVLPQYRAENAAFLGRMLDCDPAGLESRVSWDLIHAVIGQRSVKSTEEVDELTRALETTRDMHMAAMRTARPGVYEREVVAAIEGVARTQGRALSFTPIVSIHGETLHNMCYDNRMHAGQMAVNDSGAESPRHYAGDITRTIPIGGRFIGAQRDLYAAVLAAQQAAIDAIRPGRPYREVHLLAARELASRLADVGCMKGDLDAAVEHGAHALFFPHGLGHMLGLDVHDMEALGEDHVGYDASIRRSSQFGLRALRLARPLQPGFVLTVEPGLYFIPALIDRWQAEGRCKAFIDYDRVQTFRHAGGIRIEDNVLVTESGARVLGPPIPKALAEVEALAG